MYGKRNTYNYVVCTWANLKVILLFLIKAAHREFRRGIAHSQLIVLAFRTF